VIHVPGMLTGVRVLLWGTMNGTIHVIGMGISIPMFLVLQFLMMLVILGGCH
jgi:hypothetical protein